jgi:DNA-binding transcriptional MerR regulator
MQAMEKPPGEIPQSYKISEFAMMVGLPQSKIRYYEKFGLFQVKRRENGYRYYTPEDAFRVNAFRTLLQYGFSVEQSIQMLNERQEGEVFLKTLLGQKEELERQADQIRYRQKRLDYIVELIKSEPGERFDVTDIEDQIYVRASYGRNFTVSTENESELAEFVEMLSVTSYARIIKRADFENEKDYVDPSYIVVMPMREQFRLKNPHSLRIKQMKMGKCLRFQRRKTREESVRKETFESMFLYLKDHGYRMRGDILLFPAFLNLDGQGSDWETLLVPIE